MRIPKNGFHLSSLISHTSSLIPPASYLKFKKRFTLIELLVVIAIMAVLAGMLLPSLTRVKDTANGASCLNNMKQMGIASQTYVLDFSGYIFPASIRTAAVHAAWYNIMGCTAFPSQNMSSYGFEIHDPANRPPYYNMIHCPSAPVYIRPRSEGRTWYYTQAEYAMHNPSPYKITRAQVPDLYSDTMDAPWPIDKLKRHSRKGMVFDHGTSIAVNTAYFLSNTNDGYYIPGAAGEAVANSWISVSSLGSLYTRDFYQGRHNGSANVLFYDAHAEHIPRPELAGKVYAESAKYAKMDILVRSMKWE